jgi:very-short-patch-repair endonuclease
MSTRLVYCNMGVIVTMLKLIKKVEKRGSHQYGLYQCVCGNTKIIRITAVNTGSTKSCGCHRKKICANNAKVHKTTHGQTGTYLYHLWQSKVKNNSIWNNFEDFFCWASSLWRNGLTIYSENNFYDENSTFVSSNFVRNLHREQTCVDKYGYKSVLESPVVQEKIKKTNINKYGVENPSTLEIVKNKTKENNRKKYGVDYPQQLEEKRIQQKQRGVKRVGFDTETLANNVGISRSAFLLRVHKYGLDQAITMGNNCTLIEAIIKNFLDKNNINYLHNKLLGSYYPDFILTDYNIVIETDGLYWHSDAVNLDYSYHRKKLNKYQELGYRALFFRENEICNKPNIVFSIIYNALKINRNKVFARKCSIVELDLDTRKQFFNNNHLMGAGFGRAYGLILDNNLVSAIQFTNRNGIIDISRFCNQLNTSVAGGFSKLISHIIKNHNTKIIQTFIDKRYGQGNYLIKLGFVQQTDRLSFVWIKNGQVCHRLKYRGNSGYLHGFYKLWDCGQAKFVLKNGSHWTPV